MAPSGASQRLARLRPMHQQQPQQQRTRLGYQYLLSVPPGYQRGPGQQGAWPLILFLHGAGEGGPGGLDKVKLHGVPRLVAAYCGDEAARRAGSRPEPVNLECAELVAEGAITVSPQLDCSRQGYGWRPEGLIALLDELTHGSSTQASKGRGSGGGRRGSGGGDGGGGGGSAAVSAGHGDGGGGSGSEGGSCASGADPSSTGAATTSSSGASTGDGGGGGGGGRGGGGGGGGGGGSADATDVDEEAAAEDADPELTLPLRVDPDRIYVTGISMGGYGTWKLGATHPERFAALVPVCGGGDPGVGATALRDMPIWNFHGERDRVIPVSTSDNMMRALQSAGSTAARFTRYADLEHDSWTRAYNTPELWRWMLAQSRGSSQAERA